MQSIYGEWQKYRRWITAESIKNDDVCSYGCGCCLHFTMEMEMEMEIQEHGTSWKKIERENQINKILYDTLNSIGFLWPP